MSTFKLSVVTPERSFFEGDVEGAIVRTTCGDVGILSGHSNFIAPLDTGVLRIKIDGKYKPCALSNGFVSVEKEGTTILATTCEWADEIDITRAEDAQKRAIDRINGAKSKTETDHAEIRLRRALNRLNVANLGK